MITNNVAVLYLASMSTSELVVFTVLESSVLVVGSVVLHVSRGDHFMIKRRIYKGS